MSANRLSGWLCSPYLQLLCRLFLGTIFLYACLDKIVHPDRFAEIVFQYRILPRSLIHPVALILPWVEFICGVLLIAGWWVRSSSLLLSAMLAVFIAALAVNAARGWDVACGCFSATAADTHNPWVLILRDLLFLIPGLLLLFFPSPKIVFSIPFPRRIRR